jgi:hypothetical protein
MMISPRGRPTPRPTFAASESPDDGADDEVEGKEVMVDEEGDAAELVFGATSAKKGDSLELRFGLAMKKP